MKKIIALCTAALLHSFAPSAFAGESATTCASLDPNNGGAPTSFSGYFALTLDEGDTLQWSGQTSGLVLEISIFDESGMVTFYTEDGTYTASLAGTYILNYPFVPAQKEASLEQALRLSYPSLTLQCTVAPISPVTQASQTEFVSLLNANSEGQSASQNLSKRSQTLNGGAALDLSQSNAFVSTKGDSDTGIGAWAAVDYRKFNGALDGRDVTFAFGVDMAVTSNAFVGFMVSNTDTDVNDGTNQIDVRSIAYGPYGGITWENGLQAEVFILKSKPDYTIAGVSFESDRMSYGLKFSGSLAMGAATVSPFLSVRGFDEDQPAVGTLSQNSISSHTASVGALFEWQRDFGTPFASIALDHGRYETTLSGKASFTAPRVAVGANFNVGENGSFYVSVGGGRLQEDTRDLNLALKYKMNF